MAQYFSLACGFIEQDEMLNQSDHQRFLTGQAFSYHGQQTGPHHHYVAEEDISTNQPGKELLNT